MTRRFGLLLLIAFGWHTASVAFAQGPQKDASRREFFDAGLVLETGVRTGACDVLTFTPDGNYLLAAGDDKVVRVWKWEKKELDVARSEALRWPIFREIRGTIYALAISPTNHRHIAVAGCGVRDGMVFVLDRQENKVVHGLTKMTYIPDGITQTIWAVTFSPSGKKVAYGTDLGSVWVWDLASGKKNDVQFVGRHAERAKKPLNHVRFLHFTDEETLLSVAEDGLALQWTATKPQVRAGGAAGWAKQEQFRFEHFTNANADVYAVARSPDGQWLAASGKGARIVTLRSLVTGKTKVVDWPVPRHYVKCLAFDAAGKRLAIGLEAITENHQLSGKPISEVTGGKIYLYDLTEENPRPRIGPTTTHYPETLAFHPKANQLAVAGGNDHEVVLWDLDEPIRKASSTPIVGKSIWSVALTEDGSRLCFRDERSPDPVHPNRRGLETAPFKVFDLQKRKFETSDKNISLHLPLDTLGGWKVVPDDNTRWIWHVENDQGKLFQIKLDPRDGMPRCYSFFKSRAGEVRLAVGHLWGTSIFELTPTGPRRLRLLNGHEGETIALAPSKDGKTLVSASRDQTIIQWSLADWPSHPELGARFVLREGKIVVDSVDAGSPAWEANLQEGDEVKVFRFNGIDFLYDPDGELAAYKKEFTSIGNAAECLDRLTKPVPNLEFYFKVNRAGTKTFAEMITTVRQRPLWRFFPTVKGEWIQWRWRDFYYDTSERGDSYIGWLLSSDTDETPRFYRAEQYRERYHRPDKLEEVFKDIDRLAFATIEPPHIDLDPRDREVRGADLPFLAKVSPSGIRENQQISHILLWVNDYKVEEFKGPFKAESDYFYQQTVPRDKLRAGRNQITVQAYNRAGGRNEKTFIVSYVTNPIPPRLFGLFVGVGDYGNATPPQRALQGGRDAKGLAGAWEKLKNRPYSEVDIRQLIDADVSADAVLKHLKVMAAQVRPDDLFVFYLGGHGIDSTELLKVADEGKLKLNERVLAGEFWFCGPRFELSRPSKDGLRAKDIYHALANLPCRKLILLDACHSGNVAGKEGGPQNGNPVRPLSADGVGPVILAACQPRESAWEDALLGLQDVDGRAFGLFAIGIIMALEQNFDVADRNKDGNLTTVELSDFVQAKVPQMFKLNVQQVMPKENQRPTVMVPMLEQQLAVPIAQKVGKGALKK